MDAPALERAAGLRLASLENRARRPTPCGNRDVRCVVRVPLGDGRHHNAEVVLALEAWRLDEGAAIFAELRDLARRGAGPRGHRAGEPGRRGRTFRTSAAPRSARTAATTAP